MKDTPRSNRVHIGFFGKRNSGKSSLVNAVTKQNAAIVSPVAGTTADPVSKAMEINGIGACVIIDTAGFDDEGELGELRVGKTRQAADKVDIAVIVCDGEDVEEEFKWAGYFEKKNTPFLIVLNKVDLLDGAGVAAKIKDKTGVSPVCASAKTGEGIDRIVEGLLRLLPKNYEGGEITGGLAGEGDVVLLVMPQDRQAPKGRLILPQAQTIRELLDKNCVVIGATGDTFESALGSLKNPPNLIITDSQVFRAVFDKKPEGCRLTSFSVLFAAQKGDIAYFAEGAAMLDALTADSRVLIAEACTHAPLDEDIGRVKIPRMLRERAGEGLTVDIVSGTDFPDDLQGYDLIIHCGACMFNRKYVMSRVAASKRQGVPMCNYGVVMAYLSGIRVGADKCVYDGE